MNILCNDRRPKSICLLYCLMLSHSFFIISKCFSFEISDKEISKRFPDRTALGYYSYTRQGHTIRYVSLNSRAAAQPLQGSQSKLHKVNAETAKRPVIIFVHGSPGGWGDYIDYLNDEKLQAVADMIAIDRPGYGGSMRHQPQTSIQYQAMLLQPILALHALEQPVILVGHSLGGAVVARLTMDYPHLVQALIIIAGSVAPQVEKPTWYNIVASWFWINWLLPGDLRTSNAEILPLRAELEKMQPLWRKVKIPVTVIHGQKDHLVPHATVDFLRQVLSRSQLKVWEPPEAGHFILWQDRIGIQREILAMLQRLQKS